MNIESVINCVASNSISIMNCYYNNLCMYELYKGSIIFLGIIIIALIVCITVYKTETFTNDGR